MQKLLNRSSQKEEELSKKQSDLQNNPSQKGLAADVSSKF